MATTTNYGWTTPDDTALVKDGASAIRTLGSSVDTTTKALNPETTLGDIAYRSSSANVKTRLGIGSTGNVLTVAGGVPTWAAPAAGGAYTSIATGSLSGSSVTISSISGSYKHLYLQVLNAQASSGRIGLRINGDSTGVYAYNRINMDETAATATTSATQINVGVDLSSVTNRQHTFFIENYATTSYKPITVAFRTNTGGASSSNGWGSFNSDTAYTSLTIVNTDAVSYTAGTYTLFGVN
tara:strand:+ start:173 stop:892 length:720 start_codon:yes stop_codon:yes gene_type:complete